MKPLIYVTAHDLTQAKVYPGQFLDPPAFKLFRDACRTWGCTYLAALAGNAISYDSLPALVKALGESFQVKIDETAKAAARLRAGAILDAQAGVQRRVAGLKDAPYPFQQLGINTLAPRPSFLLGDGMRLGKTVQALLALPEGAAVVVLCPGMALGVWVKATLRWRPDLIPEADRPAWQRAVETAKYSKVPQVLERFRRPRAGELAIINYERLPILEKELESRQPRSYDTVLEQVMAEPGPPIRLISDEIHYLSRSKSDRTQRGRALMRRIRKDGGSTWGLTGTPMRNGPLNLLAVLTALDLLKDSFGSFPNFLRLMNGKKDYWGGYTWGAPLPGAAEALQRVMLRRTIDQVWPDLPPVSYEDVVVDVPKAARAASDAAREALAAAGISLEGIVNGSQGWGDAEHIIFSARRLLAEAKIPALIEIVEEHLEAKEPLIVFSAHRAPIDVVGRLPGCLAVLGGSGQDALPAAEAAFQGGKVNVIALTIRAGATAIELSRSHNIVAVDEEWTPDWNDQAFARASGLNQPKGVLVRKLIAPNTVDSDLATILAIKRAMIAATVDSARGKSSGADPQELLDLGGR